MPDGRFQLKELWFWWIFFTAYREQSGRMIEEALFSLMEKKPYAQITVSGITRRADISRRTFYRLYSRKDEVLISGVTGWQPMRIPGAPAAFHAQSSAREAEWIRRRSSLQNILFLRNPDPLRLTDLRWYTLQTGDTWKGRDRFLWLHKDVHW